MITYNGNNLILAPIAGYSDSGMRTLCFDYGAGLCFTEMVSAKGIYYKNENTDSLLHTGTQEKHLGLQLFGSDEGIISEVMGYARLQKFPIIDINMGCPAPKIVKNGEGCALMSDPNKVYKIIKAMKSVANNRLITAKIRSGLFNGYQNAVEVALAIAEGGADMITVHGRTREMYYSKNVDYDIIARVKESVKIPVCGNGDVVDKASYQKMLDTGVDYVMVARGAIGSPYIFAVLQQKDYDFDVKQAIKKHISCLQHLPQNVVANNMKKHIAYYLKGRENTKAIKEQIYSANTPLDMLTLIDLMVL